MKKTVIIGAGASGIMTALNIKNDNNKVILIEKNKVIGQKLSITGSGRCNITNIDSREDFFAKISENPKFFYSAFSKFSNYDLISYLEENGIKLKYEGNRVYPKNESAQKTVNTLIKMLVKKNIEIRLSEELKDFYIKDNKVVAIKTDIQKEDVDNLIIATGGLSYCNNNSFDLLRKKGIAITKLYPSLVGIESVKDYSFLNGISIKDVTIKAEIDKKVYKTKGDMIFTMKGLSGPAVMDMTSCIVKYQDYYDINANVNIAKYKGKKLEIFIDFVSSMTYRKLYDMIFDSSKKQLKTKLYPYLPPRLIKYIFARYEKADINNLKKDEKQSIVDTLKNYKVVIKSFMPIKGAIVTKGGVDLRYVSPSTMKHKNIDNLYFVGECLDIDAMTGGYNLQIAFSTAYLAALDIN